jgi:putative transposase
MPDYRRVFVPGGEYFFTVNLEDRSSDLLVRHIGDLRAAWRRVETRFPFDTVAAVVLPDHLHCIWQLPAGDRDFPVRWRMLKGHFTRALARAGLAPEGRRAGERDVWQRRFWEHAIRDQEDRQRHVDYIHNNPVKHGYCSRVEEWAYSTWRRWDVMISDDPPAPNMRGEDGR